MDNNKTYNSGISFVNLLTITFIVLKLTHVIDWSWWWVLSPSWISLAIGILLMLLGLVLYLLPDTPHKRKMRNRKSE